MPKLNEYSAVMSETGIPRARRKSRSSSRVCASSRIRPAISIRGAIALTTASKRTWSLPAPVEPCAITCGAALERHLDDLLGLEHPLHPDAGGIDAAAQVVGAQDVGDELLVQARAPVDDDVLDGSQLRRACGDRLELRIGEAAGVDGDRGDAIPAVDEHGEGIGGVKAA